MFVSDLNVQKTAKIFPAFLPGLTFSAATGNIAGVCFSLAFFATQAVIFANRAALGLHPRAFRVAHH